MNKRGMVKLGLAIFIILFLFILIFQVGFSSSSNVKAIASKPSAKGGGGAVSVSNIEITEEGNNYDMKSGRLKFEFDGKYYAIQVRRVKEDYAKFIILSLDKNKLEDITANVVDEEFEIYLGEIREIDLNKDDVLDVVIGLDGAELVSKNKEKKNGLGSASFFVRKIGGVN